MKAEARKVDAEITAVFRGAPTNELPAWLLLSGGAATSRRIGEPPNLNKIEP
jgi:hypothetical protein